MAKRDGAGTGMDLEKDEPAVARRLKPEELDVMLNARRTCDMCECFSPSTVALAEGEMRMGQCRLNPPHVQMILLPPRVVGGPPQEFNLSNWPIVAADNWCIEGFRAIEGKQQ